MIQVCRIIVIVQEDHHLRIKDFDLLFFLFLFVQVLYCFYYECQNQGLAVRDGGRLGE